MKPLGQSKRMVHQDGIKRVKFPELFGLKTKCQNRDEKYKNLGEFLFYTTRNAARLDLVSLIQIWLTVLENPAPLRSVNISER
jgi:hypothetical protein